MAHRIQILPIYLSCVSILPYDFLYSVANKKQILPRGGHRDFLCRLVNAYNHIFKIYDFLTLS